MNSILFLGLCRKAVSQLGGLSWDFHGVTPLLPFPFFPQNLKEFSLLLAIPKSFSFGPKPTTFQLEHCEDSDTKETVTLTATTGTTDSIRVSLGRGSDSREEGNPIWFAGNSSLDNSTVGYSILPLPCPNLFVKQPGSFLVKLQTDDGFQTIGCFDCILATPPPLSQEEINAIRSRPGAMRTCYATFECTVCKDKICVAKSLLNTDSVPLKKKEAIPIETAPESWCCSCGKAEFPLTYLKEGMHEILRHSFPRGESLGFIPLYQPGALDVILYEYEQLINSDPKEEAVQVFLQDHPLFWNFLGPIRIKFKPDILTKYKADFAVLSADKKLTLIEIERPGTKLGKKSSGLHSDLQKAFDQINDWRVLINEHRVAFLDNSLGLRPEEVDAIQYLVIAGRKHQPPSATLTKLRSSNNDTTFMTFDDLGAFLNRAKQA